MYTHNGIDVYQMPRLVDIQRKGRTEKKHGKERAEADKWKLREWCECVIFNIGRKKTCLSYHSNVLFIRYMVQQLGWFRFRWTTPLRLWWRMASWDSAWWRHQIGTVSALLALCAGNSPVTCGFPAKRPVKRSFDVFFDLRLNKRLSKQSWGWRFEMTSRWHGVTELCHHWSRVYPTFHTRILFE